ncbi:Transcriptional regulator, LysR family [Sterolibacterium denitrificans]|uniref:Transcriptional regulator, LysR family n=1 Tax=Sterolibacterium denitrificans TaxID=157592 RepID=A0A7Z7HP87_9PROT|nr:hydrogen peroxide-inducible genes activator [Sterolibacterium denitrificans]SMB21226.1 Transcriptional regulator, LysR family [Sterolibacterium denitrificans]
MTLTDLRYIVALARERHFGRAAEKCCVAQPTLSVAVKKLEEQLGVVLFERGAEVSLTPIGEQIVAQAQRVLAEAGRIPELAAQGRDALSGPLRIGVIYTIAPYLLPTLVPLLRERAPQMPLVIQEGFTEKLVAAVKAGDLDVIVIALPLNETGLVSQPVYEEAFRVLLPAQHAWAGQQTIAPTALLGEPLLLLGAGNCFRDQVLDLCAHANAATTAATAGAESPQVLEGSSLETIRYMVASGLGISVMPASSADRIPPDDALLRVRPFAEPTPTRCVGLAWRTSFPRHGAIDLMRQALLDSRLPGTRPVEIR